MPGVRTRFIYVCFRVLDPDMGITCLGEKSFKLASRLHFGLVCEFFKISYFSEAETSPR